MQRISTPETIARGELTVFALFETILAVSLSLSLAFYFGTLFHIAIGACIAPLLLLRSPASIRTGGLWFQKGLPQKQQKDDLFLQMWIYLRVLAWASFVRVFATLRHPIEGMRSLPDNWKRVVLCTDIGSPIELIPGAGSVEDILKRLSYDEDFQGWKQLSFGTALAGLMAGCLVWIGTLTSYAIPRYALYFLAASFGFAALHFALGLLCYVIAYLYRFSLKSTAILWLPLLYVVRTTFDESLSVLARLEDVRESAVWKLIRFTAWCILLLLAVKVLLLPNVIEWWISLPWAPILNVYAMPNIIHPWHIATGFNAVMALLGYYLFLDRAPRFITNGAWSESSVANGIRAFTFFRGIVSLYSIVVGIYLTIAAARVMAWPSWSTDIFPWW